MESVVSCITLISSKIYHNFKSPNKWLFFKPNHMRRILLIALLFISACNKTEDHRYTKQQKAEKLVKAYLDTFLKGQYYYENVKFDTLKVLYKTYKYFDPEGIKLRNKATTYDDSSFLYDPNRKIAILGKYSILIDVRRDKKITDFYNKKRDSIDSVITIKAKDFKKAIFGYSIEHRFITINTDGDTLFHRMHFAMDTDFKKIFNTNWLSDYKLLSPKTSK